MKAPLSKLANHLSLFPLLLLLLIASCVNEQRNEEQKKEISGQDQIYVEADKMPEFPGGPQALKNFIIDNFEYPLQLEGNNIVGRIIVNFFVNKDGTLSEVNIDNEIDPLLDKEAKRVISMMPSWEPGELKGKLVRVKYCVPIAIKELKRDSEETINLENEYFHEPFVGTIETQPVYPGGKEAMMNFLKETIRYPLGAMKDGLEGRVITSFIINVDGSISDIFIVRGVNQWMDAEAIRVISKMPNWEPLTIRGKPTRARFALPVTFKLEK